MNAPTCLQDVACDLKAVDGVAFTSKFEVVHQSGPAEHRGAPGAVVALHHADREAIQVSQVHFGRVVCHELIIAGHPQFDAHQRPAGHGNWREADVQGVGSPMLAGVQYGTIAEEEAGVIGGRDGRGGGGCLSCWEIDVSDADVGPSPVVSGPVGWRGAGYGCANAQIPWCCMQCNSSAVLATGLEAFVRSDSDDCSNSRGKVLC